MKIRQDIYDTYWRFAAERQNIFFKRLHGEKSPFTSDPVLQTYKFCNAYRASDRVSQYLIQNVIYNKERSVEDVALRIVLFRLLNKIETWEALEKRVGEVSVSSFSFTKYANTLSALKREQPIYGNAFILAAHKAYGHAEKHKNHLALLEDVFITHPLVADRIIKAPTLELLYTRLKELPLFGTFMAYQVAIDLNYSEIFDFSENDFTVAGPGAVRGIRKCFVDAGGKSTAYIIKWMVEQQDHEFERLGIEFKDLWGRSLHAIDCQGLFCEVDKYCRVRHPHLKSERVRIKNTFQPHVRPIRFFYPPKWGINNKVRSTPAT